MREGSRRVVVVPCLLLVGIAACGSERDSADERPAEISDPIQFEASPETRGAIGVDRWGIVAAGTETHLRGYDAKRRRLVELRNRISSPDDRRRLVEVELSGDRGRGMMRVLVELRPTEDPSTVEKVTTMEENSLDQNPEAARTVRLARSDSDAARPEVSGAGGGGGGLLAPASLTFQEKPKEGVELIKEICTALVKECKESLVDANKRVTAQNDACQAKAKTWNSRQTCNILGGNLWDRDNCRRVNQAAQDCDQATEDAIAAAKKSGACQTSRDVNTTCVDPEGAMQRGEERLKKCEDDCYVGECQGSAEDCRRYCSVKCRGR